MTQQYTDRTVRVRINRGKKFPFIPLIVSIDADTGKATTLELLKTDAAMLFEQGKIQKVLDSKLGAAYGPPRSWRQLIHNVWPPLHPDALALAAKAANQRNAK